MITREHCQTVLEKCLKFSEADETIVYIQGGKESLSRFANNYIHQNVLKKDYRLVIQSIFGKKIGRASTNFFSEDELKRVCRQSEEMAKIMPDNNLYQGLVDPKEYDEAIKCYHEHTAEADPKQKALVTFPYKESQPLSKLKVETVLFMPIEIKTVVLKGQVKMKANFGIASSFWI